MEHILNILELVLLWPIQTWLYWGICIIFCWKIVRVGDRLIVDFLHFEGLLRELLNWMFFFLIIIIFTSHCLIQIVTTCMCMTFSWNFLQLKVGSSVCVDSNNYYGKRLLRNICNETSACSHFSYLVEKKKRFFGASIFHNWG